MMSKLSYKESPDRKSIDFYGDGLLSRDFIVGVASISDLENATIHPGITGLGDSAFLGFKKLMAISLPYNCRSLGSSSFQECFSLRTAVLPEGLTSIGSSCFYDSGIINISFPSSYVDELTYYVFYGCNDLKNFFVAPNNSVYSVSADHSILIRNNVTASVGYGDSDVIRIPEQIEEIAPYFLNGRTKIRKVIFSDSNNLKRIKTMAFRLTQITRFEFPQGLVNITDVISSRNIDYVFFPKSLENVGNFFTINPKRIEIEEGCKAVKTDMDGIIYDKTGHSMLYLPSSTNKIYIDYNVTYVMNEAIRGNRAVDNLTVAVNHSVYASFDNVLYSNYYNILKSCPGGISKISIHFNCTEINEKAFDSTWIREVDMSNCKLLKIGFRAFCYAGNLTDINFPDSIHTILGLALYSSGITTVHMPASLKDMRNDIFYSTKILKVDFSLCQNLTVFNGNTFDSCKKLEECILPPNIRVLNSDEFEGCVKLRYIRIPESLVNLSDSTFKGCISLQEIEFLGSNITSIPMHCFTNCNITKISIPKSIEIIETESFTNNLFLKSLIFSEDSELKQIQIDAFAGCKLMEKIKFGSKLQILAPGALSQMMSLTNISVSDSNPFFASKDGVLYNKSFSELISFPGGLSEFEIDSTVESIASRAFFGCSKLKSLEFSNNSHLISIGSYTFYGCSGLKYIKVPSSVKEILPMAFGGCTLIETITFAPGSRLTELNSGVFSDCSSLKKVLFDKENSLRVINKAALKDLLNLEEFTFSSNLREINDEAFRGCEKIRKFNFQFITAIGECSFMNTALESINLSPSLEKIGRDAFRGCSFLKLVTYCGIQKEEFENIEAFTGFKGQIFVSFKYNSQKLFCLDVIHALDKDCMFGSNRFTVILDKNSQCQFIFSSLIISRPSNPDAAYNNNFIKEHC